MRGACVPTSELRILRRLQIEYGSIRHQIAGIQVGFLGSAEEPVLELVQCGNKYKRPGCIFIYLFILGNVGRINRWENARILEAEAKKNMV
jgi:hypothetical protein